MPICLPKLTFKGKNNYNNIVTRFNNYIIIRIQILNPIFLLLIIFFNIFS